MSEDARALIREVFPNDMKQWVNWRYQERDGNKTKIPYMPTGQTASSTDSSTWGTLSEVMEAKGFDGVGIVFNGSLLGVDFDHCVDEAGSVPAEVAAFIEKAQTYTEVSPSGTGLHAYFRLSEPLELVAMKAPRGQGRDYECYLKGRYFTVTGNPWGTVMPLRSINSEEAVELLSIIGYPWKKKASVSQLEVISDEVLGRMFASRNGEKIKALYNGDTSEYGGDKSRADSALCAHLAFWAQGNAATVEALWVASPLGAREKTQDRNDYRKRTIENALAITTETYHGPAAVKETKPSRAVLASFANIKPQPIEWLWKDRIAVGKLTLIAGDPGLGKSLATTSIAAMVSTGTPWPAGEGVPPVGDVVMLSAEDDPADTIRPRLDAAGANPERVFILQSVVKSNFDGTQSTRTFSLKEDVEALREVLTALPNPKLVIIDPISAYLGDTDSHANADVRGVLAPLSQLASEYGVAIVAVSHLNKNSESKNVLYRVMGSLAFTAAARACFAVVRDKDNLERRLLLPVKNNLAKDFTGLAYSVITAPNDAPLAVWEDQVVIVPKDEMLTGPDSTEDRSKTEWAMRSLEIDLAVGPKPTKELLKSAQDAGATERTFTLAREKLGVISDKMRVANGRWFLALPEHAQILKDVVMGKVSAENIALVEGEENKEETDE